MGEGEVAMTPPSKPQHHKQAKQNADSKTQVYQRLHGERTTMTVRILPRLKKDFTGATRQMGLSTCHVVEGLINGWLYGLNENLALVHQSPTINLTVVRDVKRVRRYAVEETTVETERVRFVNERVVQLSRKKAEQFNKALGGVADQWNVHSVEWQHDWIERARKHPELSNSALVLAYAEEGSR